MPDLLIRNAFIARPDGSVFEGDLACEDGLIASIDSHFSQRATETIDARGKMLFPGVIDPHVHFREPGKEYKEDLASGSRAAACGGVTSFLEMPNTEPPTISQVALNDKLARATRSCVVNYGFFIGATVDNIDEINVAEPVCGIKVFMGCSTGGLLMDRDEDLERLFATGDRIIAVHAEDESRMQQRKKHFAGSTDPAVHSEIRDNESAFLATQRVLHFSKKYRRRLNILHMSTREEVMLLRKDKSAWVKAEVIPNHLLLNIGDYAEQATLVQMNPPIRQPEDNVALWAGLHDGIVDFMGTDHAPHSLAEKQQAFPSAPSGMPGIETALPLMLTTMKNGRCTLAELLKWMCVGPAEAYGIPNKGKLLEGWDADLTLVDLDHTKVVRNETLQSKAGWSPYAGKTLTGWPVYTIVGGRVVYDQGRIRPNVQGRALTYQH